MTDYDVVQIGFGPVGQTNAALLGQRGHKVAVFDRWPTTYPLPRAGHVDHEIMRIFQGIGATDKFEQCAIPVPTYDWVNGDGELLLRMDWDVPTPSGWKSDYLMYQPEMEDALVRQVTGNPSVSIYRGWEATNIQQHPDHVVISLREGRIGAEGWVPTGAERQVSAKYVIGADGANSMVRRSTSIEWEDLGFEAEWLVVDLRPNDPDVRIDMPDAGQICDPRRPVSPFRWLGRNHCRWEFMLLPGETPDEMVDESRVWDLLKPWAVTSENFEVTRKTVYSFRSLLAETFKAGRTILIGDAAHLMPPFLGQGMCSGVRDAANLAWKLDLVLRGIANDSLLDTYTTERRPHVEQIIRTAMALGEIVCMSDPAAAAERDHALMTGQVPPPPPFPWLESGILQGRESNSTVGHLGVQGRIIRAGKVGKADDLLGSGWTLLYRRAGALEQLNEEQREFLDELGTRCAHVSQARLELPGAIVDIDATYARWFDQMGAEAVLVRPDFYVFGVAKTIQTVPDLIEELREQIPALSGSRFPKAEVSVS